MVATDMAAAMKASIIPRLKLECDRWQHIPQMRIKTPANHGSRGLVSV